MGKHNRIHTRLLMLFTCLCISGIASAGVLDGVKQRYSQIKSSVQQKINSKEPKENKTETVAVLSSDDRDELQKQQEKSGKKEEEKFLESWKTRTVIEPIFDSGLFVVEAGKQNRNTIVLVHGLGSAGLRDWIKIIPILEKNFHVVAVDLPGFGASGRPKGRYSPTNYAKVVHWVIDRYAHDDVFLVGHSMGGAIALRYAMMYPESIEKVILVDAAGILERTAYIKHMSSILIDLSGMPERLKKMLAFTVDVSQTFVEMVSLNHDISCSVQKDQELWDKTFANRTNANAGLALVSENFSDVAQGVKVPLNLIWGSKDKVAPLRTGHTLKGLIDGSELAIIEGAGHVPMKSHQDQFIQSLKNSIMHKSKPSKRLVKIESELDLSCTNEAGKSYSGNYRNILIQNCADIKLQDITAQNLLIKDSTVEMFNVVIESTETALETVESVVLMTSSQLKGKTPILSSGSRLDIAGSLLYGDEAVIDVGVSSRIILSVSKYHTKLTSGNLHGFYDFANDKLLNRLDESHSTCK